MKTPSVCITRRGRINVMVHARTCASPLFLGMRRTATCSSDTALPAFGRGEDHNTGERIAVRSLQRWRETAKAAELQQDPGAGNGPPIQSGRQPICMARDHRAGHWSVRQTMSSDQVELDGRAGGGQALAVEHADRPIAGHIVVPADEGASETMGDVLEVTKGHHTGDIDDILRIRA